MSRQYTGRIGIGDGWYLVFDRPFVDDPVVGDDVLTFSNSDLLVLPTVVPIPDHVTDAWIADFNAGAAARAVANGGADVDLGPIQGQGWTGSLAAQSLPDAGETALRAYLAAPRATLHLTVRFRDPANEARARALIAAVQHDAAGAAEMNRAIRAAEQADDRPDRGA